MYFVTVWHGENGSIAYVKSTEDADECAGIYSTIEHGADWRKVAQERADALNTGEDVL